MTRLTLRQVWILDYLREHPGATMAEISDDSPVDIDRTADLRERLPDYSDIEVKSVDYGTVQQAMKRLLDRGLVSRQPPDRRHNGPPYQHFFVAYPKTEDPLEEALRAPDAVRKS